ACGGGRSFAVGPATAGFYAVADLPLVNIQADVIHRFHWGSLLGVYESAGAEISFSTPSAPPLTHSFKLTAGFSRALAKIRRSFLDPLLSVTQSVARSVIWLPGIRAFRTTH